MGGDPASRAAALAALVAALAAGCGGETSPGLDAGRDAGPPELDAPPPPDTGSAELDAARDAPPVGRDTYPDVPLGCLVDHAAGDRIALTDGCNFCDCEADGSLRCTARTCVASFPGCTYAGADHAYGERFVSTDGCNTCTCAASGLACTRRAGCTGGLEEGAILLESLDEPCGADPAFTARAVLSGLPSADLEAPFLYDRARALYPESLADTTVRVRIVRENDFFAVCRLPMPEQPALDLQVTIEWMTADGAFDEGLPGYLRRNGFGFVDAWWILAGAPLGGLSGSYTPNCALDPGDYTFSAQLDPDGHAAGAVSRVCETDLLFDVGAFDRPAPP